MNPNPELNGARPLASPYIAGAGLGLVVLASILVLGQGLGASGGFARLGLFVVNGLAPDHVQSLEHAVPLVSGPAHVLKVPLVFVLLGVAVGGFVSAKLAGRVAPLGTVERGPTAKRSTRLGMALVGGMMMGYAAPLARGCTSGQALTGGAMLALGSWAFMLSVFAGGFGFAWFVRRQWR